MSSFKGKYKDWANIFITYLLCLPVIHYLSFSIESPHTVGDLRDADGGLTVNLSIIAIETIININKYLLFRL